MQNDRFLIAVDDDNSTLKIIRDQFSEEGYLVKTFDTSSEFDYFIAKISITPICIILDNEVGCEKRAGLAMLENLRGNPPKAIKTNPHSDEYFRWAAMPIIMFTNYASEIGLATSLGINTFMPKNTYDINELIDVVRAYNNPTYSKVTNGYFQHKVFSKDKSILLVSDDPMCTSGFAFYDGHDMEIPSGPTFLLLYHLLKNPVVNRENFICIVDNIYGCERNVSSSIDNCVVKLRKILSGYGYTLTRPTNGNWQLKGI